MATTEMPIQSSAALYADDATHREVERFLYHEARLLDTRRYREWLDLLADDFVYRVPVPVTRDNPSLPPWDDNTFIVEESRASLAQLWVKRHEPEYFEYAWGENPPQRARHFVANVLVSETPGSDELEVISNVLLSFARLSNPVSLTPVGREDVVRRGPGGELKLVRRVVRLDQTMLGTTHMRLIF